MNYKEITFVNEKSGKYKTAPVGFSWTTFFFGIIPALFRGDLKWAGISFLINLFTFGTWTTFVMSFMYNKLYMKDLLKNGFIPATENECKFLIERGIATKEQIDFLNECKLNKKTTA